MRIVKIEHSVWVSRHGNGHSIVIRRTEEVLAFGATSPLVTALARCSDFGLWQS
jgi:hypothetical protein